MSDLSKLIRSRRSVRTFDGNPLRKEDREALEQFISGITNPFGIPVRFVLLRAMEYGLSSPVITGETLYVAGKVRRVSYADVAFGYSLEQLVLYAWSLGIGTTWIGGTMKRALFEKAAEVADGEMMPCVSPLGYPASKKSVRETIMRKSVGADTRKPVEKLFFTDTWEQPISGDQKESLSELMEMVRWSPSAVNKQPWRIIVKDKQFHFYEKKDKGYVSESVGDMQKIDVGIALCHFMMGLKEQGQMAEALICDPCIPVPEGVEYITTVRWHPAA